MDLDLPDALRDGAFDNLAAFIWAGRKKKRSPFQLDDLKYNVIARQEEQAARKAISDAKKWKLEWREDWRSATSSICKQLQEAARCPGTGSQQMSSRRSGTKA